MTSLWEKNRSGPVEDDMRAITDENSADLLTFTLKEIIRQQSLSPVSGPFLGLGVGEAIAEKALATNFSLDNQVVLVDKKISEPDERFVESDIFDFLDNWQGEQFGLVSLIGVEYIIEDEESWQKLWEGLEKICKSGAYVVISMLWERNPIPVGSSFVAINDYPKEYMLVARKQ